MSITDLLIHPFRGAIRRLIRAEMAAVAQETEQWLLARAEWLDQNRTPWCRDPYFSEVKKEPLADWVSEWLKENPHSAQAASRRRHLERMSKAVQQESPGRDVDVASHGGSGQCDD